MVSSLPCLPHLAKVSARASPAVLSMRMEPFTRACLGVRVRVRVRVRVKVRVRVSARARARARARVRTRVRVGVRVRRSDRV